VIFLLGMRNRIEKRQLSVFVEVTLADTKALK
jgi:hypothetical protein